MITKSTLKLFLLATILLTNNATGQDIARNLQDHMFWSLEKGFPITNELDFSEVEWSSWIVTQWGWSPVRSYVEQRTYTQQRVDILTPDWAIEVEYAIPSKVDECVQQAKVYGFMTYRKRAIILLNDGSESAKRSIYLVREKCMQEVPPITLYVQRIPVPRS